jgi:hypothetical protein
MAILTPKLGMVAALLALGIHAWGQGPDLSSRLSVSTIPDKATLTCDGVLKDETPVMLNGLRPGEHLIRVEKAGYLPASRTVTLVSGERSAIEIPLERLQGLILIKSVPEGADLEISGAHRGKAPLLITDLAPGKYRVKASLAGFLSRDIEVEVENRIPKLVEVSLASDSAALTVNSKPAGATVTVNGLSAGITPCKVDRLPGGDHEVVVSLADYDVYRSTVKLQANQEQTIEVALKAQPSVLSVISTPTNAKLYVDDKLKGVTPMTVENLEVGSHVLRAEKDGYDPLIRSVEIKPAQKQVEDLQLVRKSGTLQVMIKPAGATVSVDGKDMGVVSETDAQGVGKLDLELPVGNHRVVIRLKGFSTVEKRVTIVKGEAVAVKELLKRVFIPDTNVIFISGQIMSGILGEKLPNGDIKLETQLGIYKTIEGGRIERMEPIPPPPEIK